MIKITKGMEPTEWKLYRETPDASYAGAGGKKKELRRALWNEQGHLCAYCMKRITISDGKQKETTRIEHIQSEEWCKKNNHRELLLDYHNLVLCCQGDDANGKAEPSLEYCDKSKKNACLSFDIFSDTFEKTLFYDIEDGTLSSCDPEIDHDINVTLNLNNPYLRRNRLAALTAWLEAMDISPLTLEEELLHLRTPTNNGDLIPYCGIIIWYVEGLLNEAHPHDGEQPVE